MAEQRFEHILYEVIEGNIAKVTQNRPEVMNAQDSLMLEEIEDAFVQADTDPNVRVIILAGAGKHWSSGHDLGSKDRKQPKNRPMMPTERKGPEDGLLAEEVIFYKQSLTLRNVTKPTIAMVQGACAAGALFTACMCDLIIASEDAYFWNPTLRRIPISALELLVEPYEMGFRRSKEFMWLSRKVTAQEALELGWVMRVVSLAKLQEETLSVARSLAEAPPIAIRLSKKVINHAWDMTGQRDAWDYNILMHNFDHWTAESRNQAGTMRSIQQGNVAAWLKEQEKKGA
ncbi:MAG: enoyl-CoA hydratase/isomerase family protein [Chloroflexi bacterium]|nr:enoyl-CoA hydratase/isomerase family protein [Chloroflexota bacterium]